MPIYDYVCQKCRKTFDVCVPVSEYAKGIRPACPRCKSEKTVRVLSAANIQETGLKASRSGRY